jgi:xanthine dehydrogenase accessory factor
MNTRSDIMAGCELQPLLRDWPSAALSLLEREPSVVRVIVASVRGSAPREPGACMLVDAQGLIGTIGGGNLEQNAIAKARTQMSAPSDADPICICRMTLGQDLAQCCGGVVDLWLERLTRDDRSWLTAAASAARSGGALLTTRATCSRPERTLLAADVDELPGRVRLEFDEHGAPILRERIDTPATPLWLYGAGHVGRAVVRGLTELPFDVTWIDSRQELLPDGVPANTRTLHTEDPVAVTGRAPASAFHLVMTHDHGVDFDVCHAILTRGEFAWLGLIGSASKAAKFRARLARAGVARERIDRLVCPIGVGGLTSKLPAAIAASVTLQLLQELEHAAERALFDQHGSAVSVAPVSAAPLLAARRLRASSSPDCAADNCTTCRTHR